MNTQNRHDGRDMAPEENEDEDERPWFTVTLLGCMTIFVAGMCELFLAPLTTVVFDVCQPGDMPVGCDDSGQNVLFWVPLISGLVGMAVGVVLPWVGPRSCPRPILLLPGAIVVIGGFVATQVLSGGKIV